MFDFITILTIMISIILIGLTFWEFLFKNVNKRVLSIKKNEFKHSINKNTIINKLNKEIEKRTKNIKKVKTQKIIEQAGFSFTYNQFALFRITLMLSVFLLIIVLNNILFALIASIFVGLLPFQVLMMLKNNRYNKLEQQFDPFFKMLLARYENTEDMVGALSDTEVDFLGEKPMYSEIKKTNTEIRLGTPVKEALSNMSKRTNNIFLTRFVEYYDVSRHIGKTKDRHEILRQAYLQFKEYRELKLVVKKELASPKRDAYIMLGTIPLFFLYQSNTNDEYLDFMLGTFIGQAGTALILFIILGSIWFINNKINAPIE